MSTYNFSCVFTLFKKEVLRFLKVGIQTVIGPAISSLLFLAVFLNLPCPFRSLMLEEKVRFLDAM